MGRPGWASSRAEDLAVGLTMSSVCPARAEKSTPWSAEGRVPHPAPSLKHAQGFTVPKTESLALRYVDKSHHVSRSRPATRQGAAGRWEGS